MAKENGRKNPIPVETDQMGVVKWFQASPKMDRVTGQEKPMNYGFIERTGMEDLFVHGDQVQADSYPLREKDRVLFDVVEGTKGLAAVNVRR
jgi:cold shock CspA family protein